CAWTECRPVSHITVGLLPWVNPTTRHASGRFGRRVPAGSAPSACPRQVKILSAAFGEHAPPVSAPSACPAPDGTPAPGLPLLPTRLRGPHPLPDYQPAP